MGKIVDVPNLITHDPSQTEAFQALGAAALDGGEASAFKAVVIGGGTGAPVSIRTLLSMGVSTSAVVAMADDGGSTGLLREELNATAPGDIRKCITAMAADPRSPMTQAFKMRFSFAENHTLGNLMLSALEVSSGSFPEAVRLCEELLGARGHVYCSTLDRVELVARTVSGNTIEGQAAACHSAETLRAVALRSNTEITAYEPALHAIEAADLIVLGPGSLFTSIIPNLIVPGIAQAVAKAKAPVLFVCSLADMQGETRGMTVLDHYEALCQHGMRGAVDYVLVNDPATVDARAAESGAAEIRPVTTTREDLAHIQALGTRVLMGDLVDARRPTWHDPAKLQRAFAEVIAQCRSPRM